MSEKPTKKRYVVREWRKTGIFETWDETKQYVVGVAASKYKGFPSLDEAEQAYKNWYETYYKPLKRYEKDLPFEKNSIAVDAACSWVWGTMEYKWVDLLEQKEIFHFQYDEGSNNIWEFLAIVHWLAWLQQEKKEWYSLYSDSRIALNWVLQKKCKTNYRPRNKELMTLILRAEKRLETHEYTTPLLKRKTKERGEIPADFNRK